LHQNQTGVGRLTLAPVSFCHRGLWDSSPSPLFLRRGSDRGNSRIPELSCCNIAPAAMLQRCLSLLATFFGWKHELARLRSQNRMPARMPARSGRHKIEQKQGIYARCSNLCTFIGGWQGRKLSLIKFFS
jgi:hypothetical protein